MRNISLEKRAKEVILTQMVELGEISTETVMDLIRPHYSFDVSTAREQAIRRKANNLMSQFRDEQGVRTCFNCKDDTGNSKYVNIETTKSQNDLNKVESQINKKYLGLNASKNKIAKQREKLIGQVELEIC